ncbi:phosphatidylinositol 4-kinase gamma 4 [Elaeis guineensis]|uniref:1-phosphatidylinositol 4-kinase n=1 Tax=Elaeis guineensis var. tenera TaxID=51953 RepID=A0A6I9R5T6_ELAGV|nr:phosphatidylinositol 4-kinase gamma 4 [Elaeis guineensis]XP_010918235.1 phosphatidylinositol 4-kinase gamma 4 [Elaeis guineensis]
MSSAGATLSPVGGDLALSSFLSEGIGYPHCSPESILIYLAVPGASVLPMTVLESDSISSVKLRIQRCKGFVVKKQKLVFDGRELARNDCFIRDYGVSDGNVLHLVIRVSDLRAITVKTACGKKFKFHVERGRDVAYVKNQIAKKDRGFVDLDDGELFYDGEELDDRRLIHDICKYNDAVMHLLVRRSAKVRTRPVEKDFELSVIAPERKVGSDDLQILTRKPPDRGAWVEPVIVNPKVELPAVIDDLVRATIAGLEKGKPPVMSSEGTGGAYFMQDALGQGFVAVFKPIDEEPMAKNNPRGLPLSTNGEGLKRGTRVGEGALREVAAYILDHPVSGRRSFSGFDIGFSGVPPTFMVRCLHEGFNHPEGYEHAPKNFKIGSLQMFVRNNGSCEDMGPRAFPVQEVHKICVLDIRLANADRHAGNILLCEEEEGRLVLVPIDHGYCLPENFEDCTFEWLYWPQSREPFNSETIDYIKSLDAEQDIALLKFYGWDLSVDCARTLRISTMLLKKGAEMGLTPYDIGNMLCRETVKKESKIEEIVGEAKDAVLPGTSETAFLESVSKIMDRYLDEFTS